MPSRYYPNVINVVDSLPRTPVGKVNYHKLDEWTNNLGNKYAKEKLYVVYGNDETKAEG